MPLQDKMNIAVFVDYDNIEIGLKTTLRREFDVSLCLDALKERGDIVAKFAYANWGRQEGAARQMAENAVQMVQRLPSPRGDKNGGDINLALDALEMAFTHTHVNAFAIISGDSDFIPLVNKLKEYGKTVFVVGGKAFTSNILQSNCHEFVAYENLLMDRAARLDGEARGRHCVLLVFRNGGDELAHPGDLVPGGLGIDEQRRAGLHHPFDALEHGGPAVPDLGIRGRELAAIGEGGFHRRIGLAIEDGHAAAALHQIIGRRDAGNARADDGNGFGTGRGI